MLDFSHPKLVFMKNSPADIVSKSQRVRANAVWLMNAASLAVAIGAVTKTPFLVNKASAVDYFWSGTTDGNLITSSNWSTSAASQTGSGVMDSTVSAATLNTWTFGTLGAARNSIVVGNSNKFFGTMTFNSGYTITSSYTPTAYCAVVLAGNSANLGLQNNYTGGNITFNTFVANGGQNNAWSGVQGSNTVFQQSVYAYESALFRRLHLTGNGSFQFDAGIKNTLGVGTIKTTGVSQVAILNTGTTILSGTSDFRGQLYISMGVNATSGTNGTIQLNGDNSTVGLWGSDSVNASSTTQAQATWSATNFKTWAINFAKGTILIGNNNALGPTANGQKFTIGGGNAFNSASNTQSTDVVRVLTNGNYTIANELILGASTSAPAANYTFGGNTNSNSNFTGNVTVNMSGTVYQVATTGGNKLTVSGSISAGAAAKTLTFNALGDITASGVIGGGSFSDLAINKQGEGTLVLSNTNTYTGVTTIGSGTISVANIGNGGATSGTTNLGRASATASNIVFAGGTLKYTGSGETTDRAFTLGSGETGSTIDASGSGALVLSASSHDYTGTSTRTLTLTGTNTNYNDFRGVIADSTGATSLTKSGAGTWNLSGTNTFTGTTTLSAGTLRASAAGALGSGSLSISAGTLELAADASTGFNRNTTVSGTTTIKSDRATSGAGVTQTLGTLSIGANTLTIDKGSNVSSGSAGITFGAVTLTGAPTFTVNTGALLTLGSISGTNNNLIFGGAGDTTVSGVIGNTGGGTSLGTLNKSGAGTLTLSAANNYSGATTISGGTVKLAGSGTGALGAGTLSITNGTLSVSNSATNSAGSPSIVGTANSITGGINLSSGTIDLTGGSLTVGGGLTASGGTISYSLGNTLAVTGALSLSNTVNITLTGTYSFGTFTLLTFGSGSASGFTFTAPTSVGKLFTADTSVAGQYNIIVSQNSTNLRWNLGLGGGNWDNSTSANWVKTSDGVTNQAFADGDNVTFSGVGGTVAIASNVGPGEVAVSAASGTYTFSGAAGITGTTGITKTGAGTLVINNANYYTGITAISGGGVVKISNADALGAIGLGAKTTVASGSALEITGGVTTAAETLEIAGSGVSSDGALKSSLGNNTFAGAITLTGAASIESFTSGNTLTLSGGITNGGNLLTISGAGNTTIQTVGISGAGGLTKTGNGTLNLNVANSFGGPTIVSGGTLSAITGALGGTSAITVSTGATLSAVDFTSGGDLTVNGTGTATISGTAGQSVGTVLNNNATLNAVNFSGATGTVTVGTLNGAGSTTFANSATVSTLNSSGRVDVASNKTLSVDAGTSTGAINGSGVALNKTGSGTLTLSGTSNYSGATNLSGSGILRATSASSLGSGTLLTISGGTLELANDADLALNRITTVSGAGTIKSDRATSGAGLTQTLGTLSIGANTLTIDKGSNVSSGTAGITFGAVTLTGAPTFTVNTGALLTLASISGTNNNLFFGGAGDTTVSGIIGNTGGGTSSGTLNKSGTGTLLLSVNNSYSGTTNITGGTIKMGAGQATSLGSGAVSIGVSGTLDLNGNSYAAATHTLAGTIANTGGGDVSYTGNFTISGTAARFNPTSGTMTVSGGTTTTITDKTLILDGTTTGNVYSSILNGGTNAVPMTNLIKQGNGTWTISGYAGLVPPNNSNGKGISGNVRVTGGILKLGEGNVLGNPAGANNQVIVLTNGTLDLNSYSWTTKGVLLSLGGTGYQSGGVLINTASSAVNILSPVLLTADSSIIANNGAITFNQASGARSMNLQTNNLTLGGDTGGTINSSIMGSGKIILAGTGTWNLTPTNNALVTNFVIGNTDGGTLTVTSAMQGTANTNSFTGGIDVNSGTLKIGAVGGLGTASASVGTVTVASGATYDLAGISPTASAALSLAGTGLSASPAGALSNSGAAATYLGAITLSDAATIKAGSGDITLSGGINANAKALTIDGSNNVTVQTVGISGSGAGSTLTKNGTGTLTLSSGTHSYSGATSITAGTLNLASGAVISNSAVTVGTSSSTSGALKGSGSITNGLTVYGTVNPGSVGIGTLTAGATDLMSGGTLNIQFNSSSTNGWDILSAGALTVSATSQSQFNINLLSISNSGSDTAGAATTFDQTVDAQYFEIITTSSSLSGLDLSKFNLVTSQFSNNLGGGSWSLANDGANANNLYLKFTKGSLLYYNGGTWSSVDASTGGAGSWNGTNSSGWDGAYTAVFTGTGDVVTIDTGTTVAATKGITFSSDGFTVSGGTIALSNSNGLNIINVATGTAEISSALSGQGSVSKSGNGILKLSGNNDSLTGAITVASGTLKIGSANALGAAGNTVNVSGGVLDLNGITMTNSNPLNIQGTGALVNTATGVEGKYLGNVTLTAATSYVVTTGDINMNGTTNLNGFGLTLTGGASNLTLGGNVTGSGNVTVTVGAGATTFSGSLGNTGSISINSTEVTAGLTTLGGLTGAVSGLQIGTSTGLNGTVLVNGSNSLYASATTIGTTGTLKFGSDTALGSSTVTASSGSVIDLNGKSVSNTINTVGTGTSSSGALTNTSTTGATASGIITISGTTRFVASNGDITLSGTVKTATATARTLTLAGSTSKATTITLGANVVGQFSGTSNLNLTVGSGATDQVNVVSSGAQNLLAVIVNGGTLRGANSANAFGSAAGSTITLNAGTLELANDTATSFSRNTIVGGNTTIKSDRVTSGAGLTHTLGTLSIGAQTLTIDKGTNSTGTTSGVTFGAATLTGNATFSVTSGTLNLASIGGATFNAAFAGAGNSTVSGAISTTTGTVTKSGAGTLTLAGTNTYTGATTISAGVLNIASTGSIASSAVTVDNTATLKATNSSMPASAITGAITLNSGATIDLTAGSLKATTLTVGSGANTTNINFALGKLLTLTTSGGLTLDQNLNLTVDGTSATAGTNNLITWTGSKSGSGVFTSTLNSTPATLRGALKTGATSVSADYYTLATAAASQTVDVGAVRVGVNKTAAVSLTNSSAVDATYTEQLATNGFTSTSTGFTTSGSASGIAGGASGSGNLTVGITAASTGAQSGSTTLGLQSTAVNSSGLSAQSITSQAITITGTAYDYAQAKYNGTAIDFGYVHAGATVSSQNVAIGNQTISNASYQDLLDVSGESNNARVSVTGFTGLAASSSGATTSNLVVGASSSTLGSLNGTLTLTLGSDANGVSGLSNGTASRSGSGNITTTGAVYSGLATWTTDGSGSWGKTSSGFGANWGTDQGSPGLDAGYTNTDTATFGNAITQDRTVSLDGASPNLKSITFNNTSASYTLAQGSGGTITMNAGSGDSAATISVTGNHTISAQIAGSSQINKTGTGTLTLSAANSYSGATNVNNGVLNLASTGSIINSAVTVGSGATLKATNSSTPGSAITGNLVLNSNATVDLSAGSLVSGSLTVGALSGIENTLIKFGLNKSLSVTDFTLNGNLKFDFVGTATTATTLDLFTWSGASTFNGFNISLATDNTALWNYALNLDAANKKYVLAITSAFTSGGNITSGMEVSVPSGSDITNLSGGTANISADNTVITTLGGGNVVLTNGAKVAVESGTSTGVISGAGALVKQGNGILELTTENTYTAKTEINEGTLKASSTDVSGIVNSLGTNASVDLGSGSNNAKLSIAATGPATLDKNISALSSGSNTLENSSTAGSGGLLTVSGDLTKNGTTLTLAGGTNGIKVTGEIIGTNANSDLVVSTGTVTISTANSYNGPTFIESGATLIADNASATGGALVKNGSGDVVSGGILNVANGATLQLGTDTNMLTLTTGGLRLYDGAHIKLYVNEINTGGLQSFSMDGVTHFDLSAAAGTDYSSLLISELGTLNLTNVGALGITIDVYSTGLSTPGLEHNPFYDFKFLEFTTANLVGTDINNITSLFKINTDNLFYADGTGPVSAQYAGRDLSYLIKMYTVTEGNTTRLMMSIPEPSTYGLSIGALALAAVAIRRRKQKKTPTV